jgi:hypothetical protein
MEEKTVRQLQTDFGHLSNSTNICFAGNTGLIIGAVIGTVGGVAIIAGLTIVVMKRRKAQLSSSTVAQKAS